jgi:hypothetical protein
MERVTKTTWDHVGDSSLVVPSKLVKANGGKGAVQVSGHTQVKRRGKLSPSTAVRVSKHGWNAVCVERRTYGVGWGKMSNLTVRVLLDKRGK